MPPGLSPQLCIVNANIMLITNYLLQQISFQKHFRWTRRSRLGFAQSATQRRCTIRSLLTDTSQTFSNRGEEYSKFCSLYFCLNLGYVTSTEESWIVCKRYYSSSEEREKLARVIIMTFKFYGKCFFLWDLNWSGKSSMSGVPLDTLIGM